mmetsp:Transcript_67146/g.160821  ORF Transcript_67146/g.160821 Transcript_67146/m.160821 type:complete len:206 (-) Transcript_67146:45-662(-)|eukprot:CAMPEP_0178404612 /NCGR_PEP_ID=MMETSP0689_2-20121128/17976_1 /TAXON_ID=160604 /ORGANISM="Amphidinium massartii, Strain CS-259" /LENGTH=205 /DNA_ID=CAMNT_0020025607 /DNA_START=102 /DNA_END=719 /DNA_ORIENTATION=+
MVVSTAAAVKRPEAEVNHHGTRNQLLCVLAIFLVTPAVVLGVQGFLDEAKCSDSQAACHQNCDRIFAGLEVEFIGTNVEEMACHNTCNEEEAHCKSQVNILYIGAALLLVGLLGGFGLVAILEAIKQQKDTVHSYPRAAYQEPIYSEAEQRAQKSKYAPVPKLVQTMCLSCNIVVEVEEAWKHGSKGGMRGAACQRCKQVVVGVV